MVEADWLIFMLLHCFGNGVAVRHFPVDKIVGFTVNEENSSFFRRTQASFR
jgi:hypothetical protein